MFADNPSIQKIVQALKLGHLLPNILSVKGSIFNDVKVKVKHFSNLNYLMIICTRNECEWQLGQLCDNGQEAAPGGTQELGWEEWKLLGLSLSVVLWHWSRSDVTQQLCEKLLSVTVGWTSMRLLLISGTIILAEIVAAKNDKDNQKDKFSNNRENHREVFNKNNDLRLKDGR